MKHLKSFFTKSNIVIIILLLAIFCFEQNSIWVEKYYSSIIYPFTAMLQRAVFSRLSFSIGDVFYILISIFFLYRLIQFTKKIYTSNEKLVCIKNGFAYLIKLLAIVYIAFKLLWGLNYSRLGVAHQFKLEKYNYTKDELNDFINDLITETNNCRKQIKDTNLPKLNIDSIFAETKKSYEKISAYYPFLKINQFTIKSSIFSKAGNYFGYTGYYNPFTGEAQVRKDIPSILLPFICCHEVAHQLGYASEEEANFIGCLVANESKNIYFKYSMNLELLDDALQELMIKYVAENDVKGFIDRNFQIKDCLNKQVKKDRKAIRDFFYENKKEMSNYSNFIYDKYLKLNKQKKGITSYNEVIGWILSYRKK